MGRQHLSRNPLDSLQSKLQISRWGGAGIGWSDIAAVELNEAFAAQSLACLDAWGVDPDIVNQWGGAIAIGHPLGASGVRILGTLARRLQLSGQRWGIAAICIGVGQGLAVVLENVTTSPPSSGHGGT